MKYTSPLRYPGGKSKLNQYFKHIIKINNLYDSVYVEPFAGGAGLALSLLYDEYVSKIIINDLDKHIYAFWHSILYENERFLKKIEDIDITVETWDEMKQIYNNVDENDLFNIGFSTFYLNRTNRSGILTGGIIGGRAQKGKYKIDARFNKVNIKERIKKVWKYRNRISLFNYDVIELLDKLQNEENLIYYFDPPYFNKGEQLYLNHFDIQDHIILSKRIKSIKKSPYIVTYDNVKEIRELYRGFEKDDYSLNYNVRNHIIGNEIMFYNNIQIPEINIKEAYLGV